MNENLTEILQIIILVAAITTVVNFIRTGHVINPDVIKILKTQVQEQSLEQY